MRIRIDSDSIEFAVMDLEGKNRSKRKIKRKLFSMESRRFFLKLNNLSCWRSRMAFSDIKKDCNLSIFLIGQMATEIDNREK
jgi:hypothetical protein